MAPGGFEPRSWRAVPVVGFCGTALPLGLQGSRLQQALAWSAFVARTALLGVHRADARGHYPSPYHRVLSLAAVAHARGVEADLVLRAGRTRWTGEGVETEAPVDPAAFVAEFAASIRDADYVLAVRGWGNFSQRLYETLAAGRLPLHVDSDDVLPWAETVRWDDVFPTVATARIPWVGSRLVAWHRRHRDGFEERQRAAQLSYESLLKMAGFFSTVHDRLVPLVGTGALSDPAAVAARLR